MCKIHTLAISIIAFENNSSNHYSITLSFVYKKKKKEHEVNYIFLEFSKLHVIFPHAASLNWTA